MMKTHRFYIQDHLSIYESKSVLKPKRVLESKKTRYKDKSSQVLCGITQAFQSSIFFPIEID